MPAFSAIIDYDFRDASLLEEALTHPSCALQKEGQPYNYQRLEFMGDAVLGLVVAEMLFALYPDASEGDLAKRHAALVCGETLTQIAGALSFGAHLILSEGEEANGGRTNASNLEDMCEAIIGAMYLDGGLEPVRALVRKHWEPLANAQHDIPKDAKTRLQEWAQGIGLPLPEYREVGRSGPSHAPQFVIEVSVEHHGVMSGEGSSKRQAEQEAAEALLKKVGQA